MRRASGVLLILFLGQFCYAHHGPGMRGYDPTKSAVISGVVVKCVDVAPRNGHCTNGSKGHGVLQVRSGSEMWDVTLPDTPILRKAKVSFSQLKVGTTIKVTGFEHHSKAHDVYASEILANGVKLFNLFEMGDIMSRLLPPTTN